MKKLKSEDGKNCLPNDFRSLLNKRLNPEDQNQKEKERLRNDLFEGFSYYKAEEMLSLFLSKGDTITAFVDPTKRTSHNSDVIDLLNIQKHQIITHNQGEGATHLTYFLEMTNRMLSNNLISIPIDISKAKNSRDINQILISNMGNLVEFIEYLNMILIQTKDQESINVIQNDFATIIKASGNPMSNMLKRMISRRAEKNSLNKQMGNTILANRIPATMISLNKTEKEFLKEALRLSRRSKKPKTISEISRLIRSCLGNQAKTIQLIVDIKSGRDSKRQLELISDPHLLKELSDLNISLKVFTTDKVKKSEQYQIEKNIFNWSDEKIIEMLNNLMFRLGTRNKVHAFKDNNFDFTKHLLEFADHNPRRAKMLFHDLLKYVFINDDNIYIKLVTPEIWNKVVDNWKHPISRPKRV